MERELSGLYYPNKIARIYLEVLEDIMGKNGLNSVLNKAGLQRLIDNYPPDNLRKEFDFVEFSTLNQALDDTYGPRGGRVFALRGGKASVQAGLEAFGAAVGIGGLAMKILPLSAKLKVGLAGMARIFTTFSDQSSRVEEREDRFVYTIEKCPVCWGREADRPICHGAAGLLQGGLHWVSGGKDFRVIQTHCHAMGHEDCRFDVYREPLN
ncbi:MAG: 4-vinyl reductase [Anaerolineae bacterium]|jgi:bacteriochlorophyll 4-vinyl reductase|nr:4-vinyl reductase [Anaerolineae bacterium]